jgi:hypothetical protein
MGTRWELEPDTAALGHLLDAVTRRLVTYVEELPTRPAFDPVARPGALADSLREPLPEEGADLEPLLDRLFGEVIPSGVNPASPGSLSPRTARPSGATSGAAPTGNSTASRSGAGRHRAGQGTHRGNHSAAGSVVRRSGFRPSASTRHRSG